MPTELVGNTCLCKLIRKIEEIYPKDVNDEMWPPIMKNATKTKELKVVYYKEIPSGEDVMEQRLVAKL
jgi:hypothetical protein